ncbi:MAG TPA: flavin reductase family protein [Candidatus Acidoferrum sp.]|nr:flavin reductase family protein [Candidatus Acidoferrum sp.]
MKKALEPVEKTAVITKKSAKNGAEPEFRTIEPKILYFGTPVALVSSLNEDGTTDLAPISSFWALGWTMTLGLLTETKTAENFERHRACVVNLPSPEMWEQVERLAPLTAKNPVPELKKKQFHYEPRKFEVAELTPLPSDLVKPMRAKECPVHMEARVTALHKLSGAKLGELGGGVAAEVEIVRVHVEKNFVLKENYVDPAKWSPLIYNFRHYFRLADQELGKTFRAEA